MSIISFVLVNGTFLLLGVLGAYVLSRISWDSPFNIIAWMCIAALSSAFMSPVVAAFGWLLNIPTNEVALFAGSLAMVVGPMQYFKGRYPKN